jgi:hypothetical protein
VTLEHLPTDHAAINVAETVDTDRLGATVLHVP